MNFEDTLFDGDGRKIVGPSNHPGGTTPMKIKRSTARMLITKFIEYGESHHSELGSTMWVLIEYCNAKKLAVKRIGQSLYMENHSGN